MTENFKPVSVRVYTEDAPMSTGAIRTVDSDSAEEMRERIHRQVAWTLGPDGKTNLGQVWDGVIAGLEAMTPAERGPLLDKLNKKISTGWGKPNAAGMRSSTNDARITNDAAQRQNEINRNFWAERGVGN